VGEAVMPGVGVIVKVNVKVGAGVKVSGGVPVAVDIIGVVVAQAARKKNKKDATNICLIGPPIIIILQNHPALACLPSRLSI